MCCVCLLMHSRSVLTVCTWHVILQLESLLVGKLAGRTGEGVDALDEEDMLHADYAGTDASAATASGPPYVLAVFAVVAAAAYTVNYCVANGILI